MSAHITRAQLLMGQSRYEMAERELRAAIAQEPNDPVAHALLGVALSEQDKGEEAVEACRRAIGLGPDMAYCHYAYAAVLHNNGKHEQAMGAVDTAIEIDPSIADAHALRGQLFVERSEWRSALGAAEVGLEIDAEHVGAANIRAIALTKLGRRREAGATIDAALARNPEEAVSHANMGWTLLHGGHATKAAEHFREALRLEPDNEWARAGIVEALKARNFIYRWFLIYILWMSRLKPRVQLALVVGIVVLLQILVRLPKDTPVYWVAIVLSMAYMLFATTVWTAIPLFNLLLRLDRFGRIALTDEQRRDSNWMALALLAVGAMVAAPLVTGFRVFEVIDYLLLMVAAGVTLTVPRNARRKVAGAIVLAIFAVAALHCYRWHIGPLPLDREEIARLMQQPGADVSRFTLAQLQEVLDLKKSQDTLNNAFVWGTIAMTWFAPVFHRRD